MNNYMESFSDFRKSAHITEAEKEADDNQKIKDLMEKAKEAREKANEAKKKYDELSLKKEMASEAEIALLQYKKYRAEAELTAANAKLLRKGLRDEDESKEKDKEKK
jgi:hypothetical protein